MDRNAESGLDTHSVEPLAQRGRLRIADSALEVDGRLVCLRSGGEGDEGVVGGWYGVAEGVEGEDGVPGLDGRWGGGGNGDLY